MSRFVITGIPRSGTSLLSVMLNQSENVYCANEVIRNFNMLVPFLSQVENQLDEGDGVATLPNRFDNNGALTTNTVVDGGEILQYRVEKKQPYAVGAKANYPFFCNWLNLMETGYKVIAMIRDPLFTIASWRMPYGKGKLNVSSPTKDHRYKNWFGPTVSELDAQIAIWYYYASTFHTFKDAPNVYILKYEYIASDVAHPALEQVCRFLGVKTPPKRSLPKLDYRNTKEAYKDAGLEEIDAKLGLRPEVEKLFNYG